MSHKRLIVTKTMIDAKTAQCIMATESRKELLADSGA